MYTIFINDSVLYLAEKAVSNNEIVSAKYNEINFENIIRKLESGKLKSYCICHDDIDRLWNDFKTLFTIIEAAGGLVFNEKEKVLWIYRHDMWDLPKGKVEEDENLEVAAIREVEEECGVAGLQIIKALPKTYHIYEDKGKRILKITHWYKMLTDSDQDLKPQLEEGISKVVWMNAVKMQEVFENTYGNIKLLFKFALLKK